MKPTDPTSDRGPQADALADPERSGYEQFRLGLRRLDKLRADRIFLALRTHSARKRILRAAIACINDARAVMDAAIIDDHRDLDGPPRGVRLAYEAAETDYDRLSCAQGWLMSSAKHLGIRRASMTNEQADNCRAVRDQAMGITSWTLARLAGELGRLA